MTMQVVEKHLNFEDILHTYYTYTYIALQRWDPWFQPELGQHLQ